MPACYWLRRGVLFIPIENTVSKTLNSRVYINIVFPTAIPLLLLFCRNAISILLTGLLLMSFTMADTQISHARQNPDGIQRLMKDLEWSRTKIRDFNKRYPSAQWNVFERCEFVVKQEIEDILSRERDMKNTLAGDFVRGFFFTNKEGIRMAYLGKCRMTRSPSSSIFVFGCWLDTDIDAYSKKSTHLTEIIENGPRGYYTHLVRSKDLKLIDRPIHYSYISLHITEIKKTMECSSGE